MLCLVSDISDIVPNLSISPAKNIFCREKIAGTIVPGGLRRDGLTPASGSAHARKTGSKRSGGRPWKRQITAKGYGVILN